MEPPLVSAEDHVRAGDLTDDRRRRAVADVLADRERLRRDDASEGARRGDGLLVVQGVGVLHRLRPAPDVVGRDVLFLLASADRLADVPVDVGGVEGGGSLLGGGHRILLGDYLTRASGP